MHVIIPPYADKVNCAILGIGGGGRNWAVTFGLASGNRPFIQTPLNPSSQTVSLVTLLISHYLYNGKCHLQNSDNKQRELSMHKLD